MGYGYYTVGRAHRPAGYMVNATCDRRGCGEEIDRGLAYLCGETPHDEWDDAPGCGRYYCEDHRGWVGPRGGCRHRGSKAWGRTLSDLVPNPDGTIVCCDPIGHTGPHGWEREDPFSAPAPGGEG